MPKNFPKVVGKTGKSSYLKHKMTIEDILLEAEDRGVRLKLLKRAGELRKIPNNLTLTEVYERAWEELKLELNYQESQHNIK